MKKLANIFNLKSQRILNAYLDMFQSSHVIQINFPNSEINVANFTPFVNQCFNFLQFTTNI